MNLKIEGYVLEMETLPIYSPFFYDFIMYDKWRKEMYRMKKGFMTFCTVALLATQVSTADAASNQEEAVKTICGETFQNTIVKKVDMDWLEQIKHSNINFTIDKDGSLKHLLYHLTQGLQNPNKQPVDQDKDESTNQPVDQDKNESTNESVDQDKDETTNKPVEDGKDEPTKDPVDQGNNEQPNVEKPSTPAPQNPSNGENTNNNNQSNTVQSNIDQIEAAVIELTNKERAKVGLAPLQMDSALMAAAREKSQDMKDNNYFSHTSPTFGSPFDRLQALGIQYSAAGENIAKGQRTAEEVVAAWMASQGHRENILNPNFTHIGVGYVKEGNIWTQQFIKK